MRKFFGESNQVRKITFETVAVLRPNASATSTIRTLSCSMLIPSFPNLVITWYNRNIIFSKVKRVTRNKIYSYFLRYFTAVDMSCYESTLLQWFRCLHKSRHHAATCSSRVYDKRQSLQIHSAYSVYRKRTLLTYFSYKLHTLA